MPAQAATVALFISAASRCQATLQACPASGALFQALQSWLSRTFGFFGFPSGATAEWTPLAACTWFYIMVQAVGYAIALNIVWRYEHAARLSYLARTDLYEIDWALWRMERSSRLMFALELAAWAGILSFCVQTSISWVLP